MRQPVIHDVGYATIIASRKDAVMYLATIWHIVKSDNDIDVSEQVLFEQIRHGIFESLRIKGWFGDDDASDDGLVPGEEYKDASWGGNGGIGEWLDDLKRGRRVLLMRSLVADIYRIIWRDGCFSIGEKREVEKIVDACGLDPDIAYALCYNIGLSEYFGGRVVDAIESGMAIELPKRNSENGTPKTFREEVNEAKNRIGDLNFRLILYKTGFWLALPFILFNLYLFWNQGNSGEIIAELAETARISGNRITHAEYDVIREHSKRLKINSDKDVYNHIVYGMMVGTTNPVAGVACRERDRRRIVKEGTCGRADVSFVSDVATSMIDVALVDDGELDQQEEQWIVGYLKSWGLDKTFSISDAKEESVHRHKKIGLDETYSGEEKND